MKWDDKAWKRWASAKYDGIRGTPDNWLPEPIRKEFDEASVIIFMTVLQKRESYKEIKTRFNWLTTVKNHLVLALSKAKGGSLSRPYDDYLIKLARIYNAISKGPEAAILELAGANALRGYKSATSYKSRGDAEDKAEFQKILGKHLPKIKSVRDLEGIATLNAYTKKYKPQTLRDWINEVAPKHLKAGKPKKT